MPYRFTCQDCFPYRAVSSGARSILIRVSLNPCRVRKNNRYWTFVREVQLRGMNNRNWNERISNDWRGLLKSNWIRIYYSSSHFQVCFDAVLVIEYRELGRSRSRVGWISALSRANHVRQWEKSWSIIQHQQRAASKYDIVFALPRKFALGQLEAQDEDRSCLLWYRNIEKQERRFATGLDRIPS